MKKNIKVVQENKQYGVLSLMAMIIGIVIGSGIFIKNAGLTEINGSIINTVIAWFLAAFIMIAIVVAFLEIISMTEISGEQATPVNWGKNLLGKNFGKIIGTYMTFVYFPIVMAALFMFVSDQFITTISLSTNGISLDAMGREVSVVLIGTFFLIVVSLVNTFFLKPGKYFQNVGTIITIIPLAFIILLFTFMLIFNIDKISFDKAIETSETYDGLGTFTLVLMTLPSILFAFDGFITAGCLSKEAKKTSTFRIAFIFSILFIISIYILFSIAILGLGEVNAENGTKYGTIDNVIYSVLPDSAYILAPLISLIISLSILTTVSGCFISSIRILSDMSSNSIIKDKGNLLNKTNNQGIPVGSGLAMIAMIVIWFVIGFSFDFVVIHFAGWDGYLSISIFATDLIIIGGFSIYGLIIFGAILNRFKTKNKQVPFDKNKFFWPASIISIISILIIMIWYSFTTITPFAIIMGAQLSEHDLTIYWTIYYAKLVYTFIFILYFVVVSILNIVKSDE